MSGIDPPGTETLAEEGALRAEAQAAAPSPVDVLVSAAPPADVLAGLVEQVRAAARNGQPLWLRGGGTKAFYGQPMPAEAPGCVLDLRPLCGVSSYEPSELVVTARAGTRLAELEALLATQGQCLPFEPPRFGPASTVGGMVAAGLAGPARAAVGSVRDFVLGASVLNGRAEVLSFGGQVMKNVAGYDLARLFAGSLGVLGAILEVSLKVLPLPVARATLRFDLDQAQALQQLNRWAGQPLPISASAWWDGTLVLRLAGAGAAVAAAQAALGGEQIPPELADAFWAGLRDQNDEFFNRAAQQVMPAVSSVAGAATAPAVDRQGAWPALWRIAVPDTAPPLALPGAPLIEWGGAQRWYVTAASAAQLRSLAAAAGGHATLYRSADRSAGVFTPLKAPLDRIQRELKRSFDPDGLFNPGRLYPGL